MGARNYEAIARRRPARHVIDVDDGATSVPIGILGSSAGLLVPAYCRSAPLLPVFIRAAAIVVADKPGGGTPGLLGLLGRKDCRGML